MTYPAAQPLLSGSIDLAPDELERITGSKRARDQVAWLLPCPFCGAGTTTLEPNGRTWTGMKHSAPVSWSVLHWCAELPGPSRMIERVGRDKAQAISRWNMRDGKEAAE